MRRVRLSGPNGIEAATVEDGVVQAELSGRIEPLDADRLTLPEPYRLLRPLDPPEVWCAGVTYERSRDARVEESAVQDVYTLVYDAERPSSSSRTPAAAARSAPASRSASARTRPGTSPSRRSASSSGPAARSPASRSATTCRPGRSRARTRSTCPRRRSTPAPARSGRPFSLPSAPSRSRSGCGSSPRRARRSLRARRRPRG